MNSHKIYIVFIFVILGIVLVSLFWEKTLLLSKLLAVAAFMKHKTISIRKEFLWFMLTGLIGSLGESLIMLSGSWKYANPSIFNFPFWLFFLWGYAGTLGISLYQGITKKHN